MAPSHLFDSWAEGKERKNKKQEPICREGGLNMTIQRDDGKCIYFDVQPMHFEGADQGGC